jgi:DNA polymerase I-like protein with 3'-5' exonuclease and polymerase domains
MVGIDNELGDWSDGGILAQVHDELVLEHKDPVFAFNLLHRWMEAPVQLNGGSHILPIEVSIGLDWQNMIDVKSEEDVLAAVKKLRGE